MTVSDDVRAHMIRAIQYLSPYALSRGEFANGADVRVAIAMASVEINRAEEAAHRLNGGLQP